MRPRDAALTTAGAATVLVYAAARALARSWRTLALVVVAAAVGRSCGIASSGPPDHVPIALASVADDGTPAPVATVAPAPSPTPGFERGDVPAWMPETVAVWWPLLEEPSLRHGVDPTFTGIIMLVESAGNPVVQSPAGATGLMQLMPGTADEVAREQGMGPLYPDATLDPLINIELGVAYLAKQLGAFGLREDPDWQESVERAAAAYNGGPGRMADHLRGRALPPESHRYREYVGGLWRERADASSPTLERWLAAGGRGLVEQARGVLEDLRLLKPVAASQAAWWGRRCCCWSPRWPTSGGRIAPTASPSGATERPSSATLRPIAVSVRAMTAARDAEPRP